MKQGTISNKRKLTILYIVLALCVGSAAIFAAGLALELRAKQNVHSFYESLDVGFDTRPVAKVPDADDPPTPPDPVVEHIPFIDFTSMGETIPDIVGWLQSYGTVINYPVVHGSDNDFYLSHLPDKSKNKLGAIFLDYRNSADFSDKNILIYGHNMGSGDMFGSLKSYTEQGYFEQHSSMLLFTPNADYKLVLYAGYILDSAYELPPIHFNDQADFDAYISDITSRSLFKSDAEVSFGDQLVFLCTCTPSRLKSERFIIVCNLVRL